MTDGGSDAEQRLEDESSADDGDDKRRFVLFKHFSEGPGEARRGSSGRGELHPAVTHPAVEPDVHFQILNLRLACRDEDSTAQQLIAMATRRKQL